jgi:tRNA threonylcarbamoyladenosine biosynthesis protein TsaB
MSLPDAPTPAPAASGARRPFLLAFDTSTEHLSVGLSSPRGPLTASAPGGARASSTLLPHIHALLDRAGLGLRQLDGVAFGSGPGAFTGLRTACAVAQGIGLALGLPLIPIDSLLIVAEDARRQACPGGEDCDVAVAMDARMDEVYAGRYRWCAGGWQVIEAPRLLGLPALHAAWAQRPVQILAGSALTAFGERLQAPFSADLRPQEHHRAGALLQLALRAAQEGHTVDAADALPLYVRDKVAHTTREREAARALAGRLA